MENCSLPSDLIKLFENDDVVGWGIKDKHSRFVYVNKAFKVWQSISTSYNYEGRMLGEIPVPVAEFAELFTRQERTIEQSGRAVRAITTHVQGREKIMQPVYNVQEPLYDDDNQCIGTLVSVRHVNIITPTSLLTGKINQHALFEPPSALFTEKEWEMIYLLQCNLSLKEIAGVIGVSLEAVSGRLRSCYKKAAVNSSSSLIEFCRNSGIDNYIPQFFLKKGHIVISG